MWSQTSNYPPANKSFSKPQNAHKGCIFQNKTAQKDFKLLDRFKYVKESVNNFLTFRNIMTETLNDFIIDSGVCRAAPCFARSSQKDKRA